MALRSVTETLSWKLRVGRATHGAHKNSSMHSPSCTGLRRHGEEAVVTANIKSREGKTSFPFPLPPAASLSALPVLSGNIWAPTACLTIPVISNYMKKLYLYYIKTVSGGLGGGREG